MKRAAPIALLFAASAFAGEADLNNCRSIADEGERLACYDRLAGPPSAPQPLQSVPESASSQSVAEPKAQTAPEQSPQNFGAAALPQAKPAEPKEIRAHLAGKLDGWQHGTRFALDNGQVWLCVDDEPGYDEVDHAALTITRNFLGSYWLKFEKVYKEVRVKRIQ